MPTRIVTDFESGPKANSPPIGLDLSDSRIGLDPIPAPKRSRQLSASEAEIEFLADQIHRTFTPPGIPSAYPRTYRVWSSPTKTHHESPQFGGSSLRSTPPYRWYSDRL
jgi:hypothetical protein